MVSSQPSVEDLLVRLQEEHERLSALRQGIAHGVPRPALLVRFLLLGSVVLIAGVTALIGVVGVRTVQLADAIRVHRASVAAAERAIPAPAELLDDDALRRTLAGHPGAAGRIYAARAEGLLAAGDAAGALAAFGEARLRAVAPLPPEVQLREMEALIAAGRPAQARQRLLATDLSAWAPEHRARAIALLPRLTDSDPSR